MLCDADTPDVFLSSAFVVHQPGDNNCLFHSLSFSLSHCSIVNSVHDIQSGFSLRASILAFIRDNGDFMVCLAPSVVASISEILSLDGHTCLSYFEKMNHLSEWGSSLEIAVVVSVYPVFVTIFSPCGGPLSYRRCGVFQSVLPREHSVEICLLYSSNCHYDSLIDIRYYVPSTDILIPSDTICSISSEKQIVSDLSLSSPDICSRSRRIRHPNPKYDVCIRSSPATLMSPVIAAADRSRLSSYMKSTRSPRDVVKSAQRQPISRPSKASLPKFSVVLNLPIEVSKHNRLLRRKQRDLFRSLQSSYVYPTSKLSRDASSYSYNYDMATKFVCCAICGMEGPRDGSKSLTDMKQLISSSGIKELFLSFTSDDLYSTSYDRVFRAEMLRCFDNGLIRGVSNICCSCCQQLKGKNKIATCSSDCDTLDLGMNRDVDEIIDDCAVVEPAYDISGHDYNETVNYSKIPRLSLFCGLFCGSVPVELSGLTSVEDSMISIYSAVTKVCLAQGKHYRLKACTSYTIINDLTRVSQVLPRMPSIEDTAIMRHSRSSVGKDYTYRPFKVYTALCWLKKNNHLYSPIDLDWGSDVSFWTETLSEVDVPFIEITDDDVNDLFNGSDEDESTSDEFSTNPGLYIIFIFVFFFHFHFHFHFHLIFIFIFIFIFILFIGSAGKETDIFLEIPESVVSHIEDLANILIDPASKVYERSSQHEFVCQFKNPDYYLSRCFPCLYPYGRGCPSDKFCRSISIAKYTKHMLCIGGGPEPRRFQQSSKFIFTLYNMEMKRKIGGVAYIAQKKNLDESDADIEVAPSIGEINSLLEYLSVPSSSSESVPLAHIHDEREMQKLIKRLIPYSISLQGTPTHIAYERVKLMAMIPSPIINKIGLWRLFLTLSPADKYENRFFELVLSSVTDDSQDAWQTRTEKVFIYFYFFFLVIIMFSLNFLF